MSRKVLTFCGTRLASLGNAALQERVLRGLWAMEKLGRARIVPGSATIIGETWEILDRPEEAQQALVDLGLPPSLMTLRSR